MKAVFIVFNQANTERVEHLLDTMGIRGYTWWTDVQGRGTNTGQPRMGTHTWPEMNSAVMTIIPDEITDSLLANVRKMDEINTEIGVRAFVWEIVATV